MFPVFSGVYEDVIGAGASVYHNGYTYRRPIIIPAASHGLTGTNARQVFLLQFPAYAPMKSVSNGGHVESASGWDLRFEDNSRTKLAHEIESYAPTTGALVAWVRFPSVSSGQDVQAFLYYGKSGLSGSEASATATWAGFIASIDMATGIDRSGNGADLTLTNVAATSFNGVAAGDFAN